MALGPKWLTEKLQPLTFVSCELRNFVNAVLCYLQFVGWVGVEGLCV